MATDAKQSVKLQERTYMLQEIDALRELNQLLLCCGNCANNDPDMFIDKCADCYARLYEIGAKPINHQLPWMIQEALQRATAAQWKRKKYYGSS